MNPIAIISSLPNWVQVILYLFAIILVIGLVLLIIGVGLGSIAFAVTKLKKTLMAIFYFGLGLAGKIGNPAVESLYKRALRFRMKVVNKHRFRLKEIEIENTNIRNVIPYKPANSQLSKRTKNEIIPLWEKFPAQIRSDDGHIVRSNPEKMIDDWFSRYEIFHHYEKRLPFHGVHYCDFYLPQGDVYIEYWGMNTDEYNDRRREKMELYDEYDLSLISIEESDLRDIDHFLQERLRRFGYFPSSY